MDARKALEASYQAHREMDTGDVLTHKRIRPLFGQLLNVVSDEEIALTSWNDVRAVVDALAAQLTPDPGIQRHLALCFYAVVDTAEKMCPTYVNPVPFQ